MDELATDSESDAPPPSAPTRRRGFWVSGASIGLPILVFALGIVTGLPLALFGLDFIMDHAATAFAVLLAALLMLAAIGVLIIALRRQIWQRLFSVGEAELHRIGEPLGQVVRLTSERRVAEATTAASEIVRLVMARYAWLATRRWIIGAVTSFVAVIAALAGSALLFQQNQLLRIQGELMREQTQRLTEQTRMLETQIQLGEAQRSASIVPEILAIGAAIGEATAKMPRVATDVGVSMLDPALRARIVAASLAVRPYRYLVYGLDRLTDDEVVANAMARRDDLVATQQQLQASIADRNRLWGVDLVAGRAESGELTDRIVSPERGHLLGTLHLGGMRDISQLTAEGADFSFAEIRTASLDGIGLQFALLAFADFSRVSLVGARFGGALLDQARFVRATLHDASFASVDNARVPTLFAPHPILPYRPTRLVGADFALADIEGSDFSMVQAVGANFDGAAILSTRFAGAFMLTSTFRNAILYDVDFSGADLTKVDFDGAAVFDADFLDKLAASAAPGTFDAAAYAIELIPDVQMATHPNLNALGRLPAEVQNNQPPLRLRRIAPIETTEPQSP